MVGKAEKLIESKDKQVRGAVVKVCMKVKRPMTFRRPVQHLYSLKFQESKDRKPDYLPGEENIIEKNISEGDSERAETDRVDEVRLLPRRKAAIDSDFIRRLKTAKS